MIGGVTSAAISTSSSIRLNDGFAICLQFLVNR